MMTDTSRCAFCDQYVNTDAIVHHIMEFHPQQIEKFLRTLGKQGDAGKMMRTIMKAKQMMERSIS